MWLYSEDLGHAVIEKLTDACKTAVCLLVRAPSELSTSFQSGGFPAQLQSMAMSPSIGPELAEVTAVRVDVEEVVGGCRLGRPMMCSGSSSSALPE